MKTAYLARGMKSAIEIKKMNRIENFYGIEKAVFAHPVVNFCAVFIGPNSIDELSSLYYDFSDKSVVFHRLERSGVIQDTLILAIIHLMKEFDQVVIYTGDQQITKYLTEKKREEFPLEEQWRPFYVLFPEALKKLRFLN